MNKNPEDNESQTRSNDELKWCETPIETQIIK